MSGTVSAAAAVSAVGVVDPGLLLSQHPDAQKFDETMKAQREQAKKDFDSQSAGLSDKDKQDLAIRLSQGLEQKQAELLKPIIDSIFGAIKAVADAKGLTVVVAKGSVVYGGQDITDEVMKKISGK